MAEFTMKAAAAAGLLVLVLLVVAEAAAAGVTFTVRNAASNTAGGRGFEAAIGADRAREILKDATNAAWTLFGQQQGSRAAADRRPVDAVTLVVVDGGNNAVVSTSRTGLIQLNAHYIAQQAEVAGILYREVAKIWQFDGQGHANAALLRGVADLLRLRAGYAPAGWVKEGQGSTWDEVEGGVTARFLNYVDEKQQQFVASLNAGLKQATTGIDLFNKITGKGINELWAQYKKASA